MREKRVRYVTFARIASLFPPVTCQDTLLSETTVSKRAGACKEPQWYNVQEYLKQDLG